MAGKWVLGEALASQLMRASYMTLVAMRDGVQLGSSKPCIKSCARPAEEVSTFIFAVAHKGGRLTLPNRRLNCQRLNCQRLNFKSRLTRNGVLELYFTYLPTGVTRLTLRSLPGSQAYHG